MVLSVLASDRPGVVQQVAETVAAYGGNWIDSKMARLGGAFAGIVQIEVPKDRVGGLETALAALAAHGLTIISRRSQGDQPPAGLAALLELTGSDQPGIVRDISAALARRGVSIDDLTTELFAGSMSGQNLFTARARVIVPPDLTVSALHDALESLAHDIMVDITLTPAA
jgi:glycine cleavage system regulatory protein